MHFERSIRPHSGSGQSNQYETATVSIWWPVDLVDTASVGAVQATREAFTFAKMAVFEQLGITFEVVDGVLMEQFVGRAFPGATEVVPTSRPAGNVAALGAPPAQAPADGEKACPTCAGAMWDNRVGKKNPKSPDFKCKNSSCDGVIWPPRGR